MIIEQDNHPYESLYFRTYEILSYIKESGSRVFDVEVLFEEYNKITYRVTDFSRFLLLIDWLFMNECVVITKKGEVQFHVFN